MTFSFRRKRKKPAPGGLKMTLSLRHIVALLGDSVPQPFHQSVICPGSRIYVIGTANCGLVENNVLSFKPRIIYTEFVHRFLVENNQTRINAPSVLTGGAGSPMKDIVLLPGLVVSDLHMLRAA